MSYFNNNGVIWSYRWPDPTMWKVCCCFQFLSSCLWDTIQFDTLPFPHWLRQRLQRYLDALFPLTVPRIMSIANPFGEAPILMTFQLIPSHTAIEHRYSKISIHSIEKTDIAVLYSIKHFKFCSNIDQSNFYWNVIATTLGRFASKIEGNLCKNHFRN